MHHGKANWRTWQGRMGLDLFFCSDWKNLSSDMSIPLNRPEGCIIAKDDICFPSRKLHHLPWQNLCFVKMSMWFLGMFIALFIALFRSKYCQVRHSYLCFHRKNASLNNFPQRMHSSTCKILQLEQDEISTGVSFIQQSLAKTLLLTDLRRARNMQNRSQAVPFGDCDENYTHTCVLCFIDGCQSLTSLYIPVG